MRCVLVVVKAVRQRVAVAGEGGDDGGGCFEKEGGFDGFSDEEDDACDNDPGDTDEGYRQYLKWKMLRNGPK